MADVLPVEKKIERPTAMIALYPDPEMAKILAVEGGETVEDLHLTLAIFVKNDGPGRGGVISLLSDFARKAMPLHGKIGGVARFLKKGENGKRANVYLVDIPALAEWRLAMVNWLREHQPINQRFGMGQLAHITASYTEEDVMLAIPECDLFFDRFWVVWGDEEFDKMSFPLEGKVGEVGEISLAARAEAEWDEQWHQMYPESGTGTFTYQHHYLSLFPEEAHLEEAQLKEVEFHGDLRLDVGREDIIGWTVLVEESLAHVKEDGFLVSPKPHQSPGWMDIEGVIPVGDGYQKLFTVDRGPFQIGVWREDSLEIFFQGKKIRGRYLIEKRDEEWKIYCPHTRGPLADRVERGGMVSDLRRKGQKWLIWAEPLKRPEKIMLTRDVG